MPYDIYDLYMLYMLYMLYELQHEDEDTPGDDDLERFMFGTTLDEYTDDVYVSRIEAGELLTGTVLA